MCISRSLLSTEKNAQPKSWELCFIRWTNLRTQARDTASHIMLRNCSEEASGGARIDRSICNKRPGSWNIERLLLTKENQISQVKEFSAFLCMGRCKSLGSLKSFLWYAPQLSGDSILCFPILSLLRVHRQEWLQRWLLDGFGSGQPVSLVSIPSSLRAHPPGSCNVMAWWLHHPLVSDVAGKFFSSHYSIWTSGIRPELNV